MELNKERDPIYFCYANYMYARCYLDICFENNGGDSETRINNAIIALDNFLQSEDNEEYYASALGDMGIAYWLLSDINDDKSNLSTSKKYFEKQMEQYRNDNLMEEYTKAKLNRDRVDDILFERLLKDL